MSGTGTPSGTQKWSILYVYLATAIVVGGAFAIGLSLNSARGFVAAGAIVAAFGQLAEMAKDSKEAKQHDWIADNCALFGSGVKFFGLLMIALGAIYGFEFKA